jgi:hypothetical protein
MDMVTHLHGFFYCHASSKNLQPPGIFFKQISAKLTELCSFQVLNLHSQKFRWPWDNLHPPGSGLPEHQPQFKYLHLLLKYNFLNQIYNLVQPSVSE